MNSNKFNKDPASFPLSLNDILKALHLPSVDEDLRISNVTIDSRTVLPGELYIALSGISHDGHDFVNEAVAKGAYAVIVSKDIYQVPGAHFIKVPDTLKALACISQAVRSTSKAKLIAITGSVGKTTTKDMLAHVLSQFGETVASKASFNNHWGVPLSLMQLRPITSFGILEIGMNRPGEIAPLSKLVSPDIAVITAIGEAHIAEFGSTEKIAQEKADIFAGMQRGHRKKSAFEKLSVLNQDTPHCDILENKALKHADKIIKCSLEYTTDVMLLNEHHGYIERCGYTEVTAKIKGNIVSYKLPLVGKHFILNSLLVLAVCSHLQLDMEKVCKAISTFKLPAGRGVVHGLMLEDKRFITLIDDAYNANPASMRAGITAFGQMPFDQFLPTISAQQWVSNTVKQNELNEKLALSQVIEIDQLAFPMQTEEQNQLGHRRPRKIVVLGEMLELGEQSQEYHEALADLIEEEEIDAVLCCGLEMKHLHKVIPLQKRIAYALKADDLIEPLMIYTRSGDMIYVKGSKNSRVSKVVDFLLQNSYKPRDNKNPFLN